jgi:hypothetical protein
MAATAHLTSVAPDTEKFTVPIGARQIAQAQSLLTSPKIKRWIQTYDWQAPKPFRAGKRGRKGVSDRLIGPVGAPVAVEAAVAAAA